MLTEHMNGEVVVPGLNFCSFKSIFRIDTAVVASVTQCDITDNETDVVRLPEGFHADPRAVLPQVHVQAGSLWHPTASPHAVCTAFQHQLLTLQHAHFGCKDHCWPDPTKCLRNIASTPF